MSFWDVHFLAGFGLACLIGTICGIGYCKYRTLGTLAGSKAGRFTLWAGFFFSLALLHLWLDSFNPVLWIGG